MATRELNVFYFPRCWLQIGLLWCLYTISYIEAACSFVLWILTAKRISQIVTPRTLLNGHVKPKLRTIHLRHVRMHGHPNKNDNVRCDCDLHKCNYIEYNHNSMLWIHVLSSNNLYVYMLQKDSVQLVVTTSLFKDAAAAAASATSWSHVGIALNWTVSSVAQNALACRGRKPRNWIWMCVFHCKVKVPLWRTDPKKRLVIVQKECEILSLIQWTWIFQ